MKPLLITSGEPAGIGPDVCLALADCATPLVVMGDKRMLAARAQQLGLAMTLHDYSPSQMPVCEPNQLTVYHVPCEVMPEAGLLNPKNAPYVIDLLTLATQCCLQHEFSGLVTAPLNKAILNQAGFTFTGHTEFLAEQCKVERVVMMLVSPEMRVALVTTHLPLRAVPDSISQNGIIQVVTQLNQSLKLDFGIAAPKILLAGLNPHAGEGGYLGREEIEIITPALAKLRQAGIDVSGPMPADTMFTEDNSANCAAFVAMYHDQGLSVLKYASFGQAVNVTLGLPIIRTSVDHGTALELAGSGQAHVGSLLAAVKLAGEIAAQRAQDAKN